MALYYNKRLAREPGLWRVDAIGPLPPGDKISSQAAVYFSGIAEEAKLSPYKKIALNHSQLVFPIHVASIREFRVGSLWRDGKKVAGAERVDGFYLIDTNNVRFLRLDEPLTINDQETPTVLPDSHFDFGGNRAHLKDSLYAIAPVLSNAMTQWLVIPASELLRFYTGVSSRFLSSALRGRFDHYIDWSRCGMDGDMAVIHIKEDINRKEAAVLARAVASRVAKTSLLGIHKHLAAIQANNAVSDVDRKAPLCIKAMFPFAGTTTLQVAGKRMPFTTKSGTKCWAIFAMEILHCTHPFDCAGIRIQSDDPFKNMGGNGGEGGEGRPPKLSPTLKDDDEDEDTPVGDEAADQRLRRLVIRTYTNQFGAFEDLKFEHSRPPSDGNGNKPSPSILIPVDELTTGDGSNAGDAQGRLGISEFQSHVGDINRDLSLFIEMLKALKSITEKRKWTIKTRKLDDGLIQGDELIAVFPERIGKQRTWHKIIDADGNERTRQVVWAEINCPEKGPFLYLLEMELKPRESGQCTILLYLNDFSKLQDDMFKELLILTAIQNRWPNRHNKWTQASHEKRANEMFSKVQLIRINHPANKKSKEEKSALQKAKVNPAAWGFLLLEKVDELVETVAT